MRTKPNIVKLRRVRTTPNRLGVIFGADVDESKDYNAEDDPYIAEMIVAMRIAPIRPSSRPICWARKRESKGGKRDTPQPLVIEG